MLHYFVEYSDRSSGGVCESFTVTEDDGVPTITVSAPLLGRADVRKYQSGRWSFYSAGTCLKVVDLDTAKAPPVRTVKRLRGESWTA